ALQSPHAATGAGVDVVEALGAQGLGAAEIVDVVGVAAVNQDVAALEPLRKIRHRLFDHCRRYHHPGYARLFEFRLEVIERGRADCTLFHQRLHRVGTYVEDHALMTAMQEPPHHVGAHPAQTDHTHLHCYRSLDESPPPGDEPLARKCTGTSMHRRGSLR